MTPGQRIAGRFEIERRTGSGGMGAVYKARDLETNAAVAVKVLHDCGSDDVARFAREAKILAQLTDAAVVRYVAHGATPDGKPFLAMEWLEGENLAEHLDRAELTFSESLTLTRRIAAALAAVHARGVVHRDLKPSNIFLVGGRVGEARLIDFGIARGRNVTVAATRPSATIGTLGYMSPEQARGGTELDARADVFALGCVLFECLTGRAAYAGDNIMAVLAKLLLAAAPRVREVRPDAPEEIDALVARMMSKEPAERPADGAAVVAELDALSPLSERSSSRRAPESRAAPALTEIEQRLVCVLLVGAGDTVDDAEVAPADAAMAETRAAPALAPPAPLAGEPMPTVRVARPGERTLDVVVAEHGGNLDRLMDGTWVVTLASARAREASAGAPDTRRRTSPSGAATDQAGRAARCALAVQAMLPRRAIALATGRGQLRGTSPAGEAIDRAARLLQYAERERARAAGEAAPGIRIDALTAGLLEARFDVETAEGGAVLRGERTAREAARTLLGVQTPCVGRDRELRSLEDLFAECVEQPAARAVVVTAGAGVGKSRLRHELTDRARRRGEVEIWIARGDPLRAGAPFGLLAQVVRQSARILDNEPLEARRQKLTERVARHVPAASAPRVAEFLGAMIGTPFPDDQSVQLRAARSDPVLMGDQLRRAWLDFLEAECRAQPVLLLLEDLHWGDHPSLDYVGAALRLLSDSPLMVVGLARPEVDELFPNLWADAEATAMRLSALSRKACEKLVRDVLGDRADPEAVARIVERAAGNAFFLEELVRAVAEGRGEDLPDTVLAMVQSRLEGLASEERRVLRAGAVLGQVFWRGAVAELLGGASRAFGLDAWLAGLTAHELIARRLDATFQGEAEYAFRHALVREAAYEMLTEDDRALGHRLAGAWLEAAGQQDAAVLAEHFERGGEPARALGCYVRAAEQALEGNDLGAVIRCVDRALRCGADGESLGLLSQLRAEAHRFRGEFGEAERWALEARRLLPQRTPRWYLAVKLATTAALKQNRPEAMPARIDDLLGGWSVDAPSPAQVAAVAWTTAIFFLVGRYADATAFMAKVEAVAGRFVDDPPLAGTIAWSRATSALFVSGDLNRHREHLEEAIASFERAGDLRGVCGQRANAGFACNELGAYAEAVALLRPALADAERMGLRNIAASARQNLGGALARLGELAEACAVQAESARSFAAQREPRMEGASRAYLAGALLRAGDLDGAGVEARKAVELLEAAKPLLPSALATLGAILLAAGRPDEALAHARRAFALLAEMGQIEEGEALVRLTYAEALWATGDHDGARAAIAEAAAQIDARAKKIADLAWRARFLEQVTEHARTLALREAWGEA